MSELKILVYADQHGHAPFESWFEKLDARAQAKVTVALDRLKRGNVSNVTGVGESVFELKLDWGPGYRLYFGRDGDRIVILLLGGTKKRQSRDIATAKSFWLDYKSRKPARPK
jgi:putative addiction module killer protein